MSQIWPDIPELQDVPAELRGPVWMRAYFLALRRRSTWLLGLLWLSGCLLASGTLGYCAGGVLGAVLVGVLGGVAGSRLFVRITMHQARREVREVLQNSGWEDSDDPVLRQASATIFQRASNEQD